MKTVKEIATQLNVSIHTVRQWIKWGKLKAEHTVTGYIVKEEDLQEFLSKRK